MQTISSLPHAIRRDFSIRGNEVYPSWSNIDKLLVDNGTPPKLNSEINIGYTTENFARGYVSLNPTPGYVDIMDVRLVKNNVIVGANLIGTPVTLPTSETLFYNDWSDSSDSRGAAIGTATVTFDDTTSMEDGWIKSMKVVTTAANSGARLVSYNNATLAIPANKKVWIRAWVKSSTAGTVQLKDNGSLTYDSGYVDLEAGVWKEILVEYITATAKTEQPRITRSTTGTFWVSTFEIITTPIFDLVIPVTSTLSQVKDIGYGLAISYDLYSMGGKGAYLSESEHLVMSDFRFSLPQSGTVQSLKLTIVSATASTFAPPNYPSIVKLFNMKVSAGYTLSSGGLELDGYGKTSTFLKFEGYEHNTEKIDRRYQYMTYAKGKFIGEINDVDGYPVVRTALNSFPSDVTVDVARNVDSDQIEAAPFDIVDDGEPESLVTERNETMDLAGETVSSVGEGTVIEVNNDIDIYEYYGNYEGFVLDDGEPLIFDDLNEMEVPIGSPEGKVYFRGYVSKYDLTYGKKAKKTSRLTLLSHTDEYNNIILEKTDEDFLSITGSDSSTYVGFGRQPQYDPARDNFAVGQSFILSGEKVLSTVYVKVKRWGATDMIPSQYPTVTMQIVKGNPGEGGVVVASATAAISENNPYWQAFSLPTDFKLVAAQRYSLIFTPDSPMQASMYSSEYPVRFFASNTYGDGAAYYQDGTRNFKFSDYQWHVSSGVDVQVRLSTRGGDTLVPMFSQDPSVIMKKIADFGRSRGSVIKYTDNSITVSDTTVSAKFNLQTLKEALDATITYAPTDWYWYIDQSDLTLYLNKRSEEVSHTFTLGKDIEELKLEKSMEDLVNEVYFSGGNAIAAVPVPYQNSYAFGVAPASNRVSSLLFMPEPGIEYKIYGDYPSKSTEVMISFYNSGAVVPTTFNTWMESGKMTYRYDPVLEPTLTGISIGMRATDGTALAKSSATLAMMSDSNVFRHLVNEVSQNKYRKALHKKSDQRVTNSASADIIASSEMERNPEPIHAATLTIVRNEYMKTVSPGQLVDFRGFGNFIDFLELLVMEVELSRDIMTLSLGAFAPKTSKRLEDLKRNLQILEHANNPNSPTGGV